MMRKQSPIYTCRCSEALIAQNYSVGSDIVRKRLFNIYHRHTVCVVKEVLHIPIDQDITHVKVAIHCTLAKYKQLHPQSL